MAAANVYLAPGASGSIDSLRPHADGLHRRGVEVTLVELPKGQAERAVPTYRAAVTDSSKAVIGGHSYGGRVASLLAADEPPAALVLLSYPLHAPGQHAAWDERTAHWSRIGCPVLLLSGEADPFARIDLLRLAVERLSDAKLVTYPKVGHGLRPVLDTALDEVAAFIGSRT